MTPSCVITDSKSRVRAGLRRESQIAEALKSAGLPIRNATNNEDKYKKIDRWIAYPGKDWVPLQIKFRETGKDLLFEVYDTWYGWNDPRNKIGRDMEGQAKEYAVLLNDEKTVVKVPVTRAKQVIDILLQRAKRLWTTTNGCQVLSYWQNGTKLELRIQHDPANHRLKMIAYIPPEFFSAEQNSQIYHVNLPFWQK